MNNLPSVRRRCVWAYVRACELAGAGAGAVPVAVAGVDTAWSNYIGSIMQTFISLSVYIPWLNYKVYYLKLLFNHFTTFGNCSSLTQHENLPIITMETYNKLHYIRVDQEYYILGMITTLTRHCSVAFLFPCRWTVQ